MITDQKTTAELWESWPLWKKVNAPRPRLRWWGASAAKSAKLSDPCPMVKPHHNLEHECVQGSDPVNNEKVRCVRPGAIFHYVFRHCHSRQGLL